MAFPYHTAMVTGASSGIGASFARALAAKKVNLVIVARRVERLERLSAELRAAHGIDIEVIGADLSEEKQLALLAERVADPDRPIDLLVNNAGNGSAGNFADEPIERAVQQVRLNVIAPMTLIRAITPEMIRRGGGGIINVSSLGGFMPMPGSATYGACKAFSSAFGESLALELKEHRIQVTNLWTGLTRTEFHEAGGYSTDTLPKISWARPEDVAAAGLTAIAAGKAISAPGRATKMFIPFARFMPRAVLRKVVKPYVRA